MEYILEMLEVDYVDLKKMVLKKLKGLSKKEKVLVFEFLCRNPQVLLMFLTGDMTPEEAISLSMKSNMGLENTEIDIQVGRFSSDIVDDDDVINAVAFGGELLILCLMAMSNKKRNNELSSRSLKNKVSL